MKLLGSIFIVASLAVSQQAMAQYGYGQDPLGTSPDPMYGLYDKINQSNVKQLYRIGYTDLLEHRFESAASFFEEAASSPGASNQVSYLAGASHFLSGNADKASFYLRKALRDGALSLPTKDRKMARQMLGEIEKR